MKTLASAQSKKYCERAVRQEAINGAHRVQESLTFNTSKRINIGSNAIKGESEKSAR